MPTEDWIDYCLDKGSHYQAGKNSLTHLGVSSRRMDAAAVSPDEGLAGTLVAVISRRMRNMDISSLFQQLGIAFGLRMPVGSRRDSSASPLTGVGAFPSVTVLGVVCGFLSQAFGGWILAQAPCLMALQILPFTF